MAKGALEIICSSCGADTFLRREPEYDGFVKKGEKLVCVSCGYRYAGEADVPYKQKRAVSIFNESDKFKKVEIFKSDEVDRNCRHCKHYVVNPFTQRCGLHNKIVQATDLCDKFEKLEAGSDKPENEESGDGEDKNKKV